MRIAVFGKNQTMGYSGGRYYSWLLALGLAEAGNQVHYITNAQPQFLDDFKDHPGRQGLSIHLSRWYLTSWPKGQFDLVFIVPHLDEPDDFFVTARLFAALRKAKLVLLNFESANWFNSMFKDANRDEFMWNNWRNCTNDGALILSLTAEGEKYAKDFYIENPNKTFFAYAYPPINNYVADQIQVDKKENQIIIICRFSDKHKGGGDILGLFCEQLRGTTFTFIVGNGGIEENFLNLMNRLAESYDIQLRFLSSTSDSEKYKEIKKSRCLVFLSYFEGYGYPPVEALYCNTPVVAYELPVLKEVSGSLVHWVPAGNFAILRNKVSQILNEDNPIKTQAEISPKVKADTFAGHIHSLSTQYLDSPSRPQSIGYALANFIRSWAVKLLRKLSPVRYTSKLKRKLVPHGHFAVAVEMIFLGIFFFTWRVLPLSIRRFLKQNLFLYRFTKEFEKNTNQKS